MCVILKYSTLLKTQLELALVNQSAYTAAPAEVRASPMCHSAPHTVLVHKLN